MSKFNVLPLLISRFYPASSAENWLQSWHRLDKEWLQTYKYFLMRLTFQQIRLVSHQGVESEVPGTRHHKQLPMMSSNASNAWWRTACHTPRTVQYVPHIFCSKKYMAHFRAKWSEGQKAEAETHTSCCSKKHLQIFCCTWLQLDTLYSQAQKRPAHGPLKMSKGTNTLMSSWQTCTKTI